MERGSEGQRNAGRKRQREREADMKTGIDAERERERCERGGEEER